MFCKLTKMLFNLCFLHLWNHNVQIHVWGNVCFFIDTVLTLLHHLFSKLSDTKSRNLATMDNILSCLWTSHNLQNALNSILSSEHSMVLTSQASKCHYNAQKQYSQDYHTTPHFPVAYFCSALASVIILD